MILGEDREATGILLSIDGDDGIVRMELDDQLKILNLRFLGRLEHWVTSRAGASQHGVRAQSENAEEGFKARRTQWDFFFLFIRIDVFVKGLDNIKMIYK